MRAAVAGVLVVLGIGIGWGLYGNTSSPLSFTSDPGAKSDGVTPMVLTPPRQLHSVGGLTGLIEQMKQKFGDTMGYRLSVYPDYASLTRPDPGEERRELNYTYRGGWDDPSTSSKSSDATEIDLSQFDIKTVVGVLRGAPETLGHQTGRRHEHLPEHRPGQRSDHPGRARACRSTCRATTAAATSRWTAPATSRTSATQTTADRRLMPGPSASM